ncbi:hypothetical protein TGS27_2860 [Geobacillus stearothermophilus]|nr:hypothetical protein GS8_1287 [Geobacillus stearothermophilus]KYD30169.1 hypothetical protein B4109_1589 [Geobacillus stearothermophilus]KYD34580.1 hypothetical protein B4114_1573 [Geobacillus stearothermophilus]OAO77212.1 hypothetical protein TGS27_2860 [Geobacillus stearothermophilus]
MNGLSNFSPSTPDKTNRYMADPVQRRGHFLFVGIFVKKYVAVLPGLFYT